MRGIVRWVVWKTQMTMVVVVQSLEIGPDTIEGIIDDMYGVNYDATQ